MYASLFTPVKGMNAPLVNITVVWRASSPASVQLCVGPRAADSSSP